MNNYAILAKKTYYKVVRLKNRIWKYLPLEKISVRGSGSIVDKSAFVDRLFFLFGDLRTFPFLSVNSSDYDRIIEWSNHTLQHDFDYLGSGLKHLDPIAWNTDFKSGFVWDKNTFYSDFKPYPNGTDIKVPWELSRGHHLLWLGMAYKLTNRREYAEEIIHEIEDWIDENPLMRSVNWTCTMEVAIRSVNWLYALFFISDFEGFTDSFSRRVTDSLCQHLFYIRSNPERTFPYSNNHYSANVVGEIYLTMFFKKQRLKKKAVKALYADIRTQVLPSGCHYEKSISYHRLVVEMYSYTIYMLKRCNEVIPVDIIERISKMYDYTSNYTKPTGLAPLVADNDDGRFLPFVKRDFREHDYLNDKGSLETLVVSNGQTILFNSSISESQLYVDAGMAIEKRGSAYLIVTNAGFSKITKESDSLIWTHTHNDLLSFELSVFGKDLIIDPGTYVYTSDKRKRNEFRSTSKHNTVVVDGEEQNVLSETAMFAMRRNVHITPLIYAQRGIAGSYTTIRGRMSHRRLFFLEESKLVILDIISKEGKSHEAVFSYHLAPKLTYGKELEIQFSKGTMKMEDTEVSPSYGVSVCSKKIINTVEFDNTLELKTTIIW